jgi:hypothetical protein
MVRFLTRPQTAKLTRDKVKEIKIEFWADEKQAAAICTYVFQGWIASFSIDGGEMGNHILSLALQPALDPKQYVNITLGN